MSELHWTGLPARTEHLYVRAMALMRRTPEPRRRQRHCGVVLMAADAVGAHKEQEMAKLSDTQLIVLSTAAARNDGAATIPDNKAAASKLRASLVSRKLMREVGRTGRADRFPDQPARHRRDDRHDFAHGESHPQRLGRAGHCRGWAPAHCAARLSEIVGAGRR
jgi:hypothetical protein